MVKDISLIFGENLKRIIEESGLSRRYLAEKVFKVSQSTLSRWINGENDKVSVVLLVANYFNKDLEELLS